MSSKWTDLKTRTISAVAMIAGFLIIMQISYGFQILLFAAYILMYKEWINLTKSLPSANGWNFFGFFYLLCGVLGLAILDFVSLSYGTYFIVILVVAIDVGGYVFGKFFGRHKLAPKISPGKTWEGFIGSLLSASIVAICIQQNISDINEAVHLWEFTIIFGIIPAGIAVAGDLLESYLKRRAGVKDSGTIIPGHGGLLDRVDGLIAVSVYFFFIQTYLLIINFT